MLRKIFVPKRKWQEAGDHIMRSFVTFMLLQVLFGKQTEDKMDKACSIYGQDEKCIQNFTWKTSRLI
jgi:hypothetical protein